MSTSRRLLVVVYNYPPSLSVAAMRWAALTKYLGEMGHSVTVVTSDAFGTPTVSDPVRVLRPRSIETAWPFNRCSLNPRLGWAPVAIRVVRHLVREQTFDCLITTSPPESAHLVGLLLGHRRPAWVADFRDGWCFEPYTVRFHTRTQLALDAWLERKVAQAADCAIGATRPITEDLAGRLGVRARWISNGWDPAMEDPGAERSPSAGEESGLRLVYTGRLGGPRGRTPGSLFEAMKAVASETDSPRIKLVFAGTLGPEDRMLIDRTGVADLVQYVGLLDRAGVAALQRSADVLVLLTSQDRSQATGKLFEYLAAGKPILALAEGTEADRLIRETGTGVVVPPDDILAIADALRRAARGDLAREYAPRGIEPYAYPRLADEVADIIEEAIAVRASRERSDGV